MKVKIDDTLICIPPYISATWDQITFLQSEEDPDTHLFTLILHLTDNKEVRIPHLDPSLIDIAFSAHIRHLETKGKGPVKTKEDPARTITGFLQQLTGLSPEQLANIPIRFGISGLEGMPGLEVLQHNQAQSNASDIPSEALEKITAMLKMMINGDIASFPKPEPHCNCPHCQVSRALHGDTKDQDPQQQDDPSVPDEELQFRDWDIAKKGDQLYLVTNPLDIREQYSVFLGEPIGCTCGHSHCEHIKAVLYS